MNKLLQFAMLSCKKASALTDKKTVIGLTWIESVQVRLHTSACAGCANYVKQTELIDNMLYNYFGELSKTNRVMLENSTLKERIISRL